MSVARTLELLRAIQHTDDDIRALEGELAEMPKELARLREDHDAVEGRARAVEAEAESIRKRRREVERDIAAADQTVVKFENDKLKVKTNEEFWAINNQIALEKKKKSDFEDQLLLVFDEEESAGQRLRRLKEELVVLTENLARRQVQIDARTEDDRHRLQGLLAERGGLIQGLDERLLARYETIRQRKGGSAVVSVLRGGCGGCHTQQPPQKINEIRKQDAIHMCDSCGRFLLWSVEEAPAA